jgi:formate--tetrahydrofolate ligase
MASLRPIHEVSSQLGLRPEHVVPWGRHRAKVELAALAGRPSRGRLVLVSAITPTPPGEGKTTTSVALTMGLCRRGRNAVAALREPSLGPVFGVKGGGTGGGASTLEPAQDINLHFTGDVHAVTAANNLLAALVDNVLHFRHPIELDPRSVRWRRCLDMNDRALREIVTGLGRGNGVVRETGFDITAASEMMAILALAEGPKDLEARCARIVVGQSPSGEPVTAGQLKAASSMAALLQEALLPNLVQTREGGPAIVHAGPFANIAHGCSSVLGTRLGLAYADEVVTEAGFGFELGGEKFLDIKCRSAGLWPRGVVLVATLRALKFHGGAPLARVSEPDSGALERGFEHLAKHLETVSAFGLPAVVALNRFPLDTEAELQTLKRWGKSAGVPVAVCEGFAKGGEGALELADAVLAMLDGNERSQPGPRFLYPLEAPLADKVRAVARTAYGAKDVLFTSAAERDLLQVEKLGGGNLPVCLAKTHLSLSDDPARHGRPRDFTVTVRELRLSAGAGFVVALTGEILTLPGLPKEPASNRVVVHPDGRVTGLMQGE